MLKKLMILAYLFSHPAGATHGPEVFKVTSPAFRNHGTIPKQYTCLSSNVPPPLKWTGVPKKTESLVLIVMDRDAPKHTWYHWDVYNIPAKDAELNSKVALGSSAKVASNSWGNHYYQGPCPSSGVHHYNFQLYALDAVLDFSGKSVDALLLRKAMRHHILARALLVGRFGLS
jgi:Raf kinase inhibitor-like YbhB/YbcL family protein